MTGGGDKSPGGGRLSSLRAGPQGSVRAWNPENTDNSAQPDRTLTNRIRIEHNNPPTTPPTQFNEQRLLVWHTQLLGARHRLLVCGTIGGTSHVNT